MQTVHFGCFSGSLTATIVDKTTSSLSKRANASNMCFFLWGEVLWNPQEECTEFEICVMFHRRILDLFIFLTVVQLIFVGR